MNSRLAWVIPVTQSQLQHRCGLILLGILLGGALQLLVWGCG